MFERLRRSPDVVLDPELAHAPLIYSEPSRRALEGAYRSYLDVGRKHEAHMIVFSATWRANSERIKNSKFASHNLNEDNIQFLMNLRKSYGPYAEKIIIGGLIGCRGDAYKPEDALGSDEALRFHESQAESLANAKPDFLFASTLPSSKDAKGIALAMAHTKRPYILSFVIRPNGNIFDGVPSKVLHTT